MPPQKTSQLVICKAVVQIEHQECIHQTSGICLQGLHSANAYTPFEVLAESQKTAQKINPICMSQRKQLNTGPTSQHYDKGDLRSQLGGFNRVSMLRSKGQVFREATYSADQQP